jgi:hypothetical protein
VIDGMPLATAAAGDDGRLEFRELPDGAPEPLEIESIALHDAADASVLSAALP